MNPAISDFMIHVSGSLSEQDMVGLADMVCRDTCVANACVSQSGPHLIMVSYDSNCESARDIVLRLNGRGIHAQAVGM